MPRILLSLAWRDLRGSGRALWVFCACLALGVALIAAGGGLYRQVSGALLSDTRALLGGDLEIEHGAPIAPEALAWMRARGTVSLLVELRTMLAAGGGQIQLVELQAVDDRYPLYGEVELAPAQPLAQALGKRDGVWGAAFDPLLAARLGVGVGDRVRIGGLEVELRARIERQPDRSLSASWRGPPLLITADALKATGLVQPASRVEYEYHVRTEGDPDAWRAALLAAFPDSDWEIHTFADRSRRIAEVLDRLGSVLLLIGLSTLFIGGLGVFNSVQAYLHSKLGTIATLRAVGLRERRLAAIYLAQVLMLAGAASLAGALAGGGLALAGAALVGRQIEFHAHLLALAAPLAVAIGFGLLTALAFALPAIGRALTVTPAALFRDVRVAVAETPARWWLATGIVAAVLCALIVAALPRPLYGLGFLAVAGLLLVLLEALVRGLRVLARRIAARPALAGRFQLRLALAGLHRRGSALRPVVLSLGSALTLLVAGTLVVAALLRMIDDTIPARAPALVFYDIPAADLDAFRKTVEGTPGVEHAELAPLVLGRLTAVNGEPLRESADTGRRLEARDEQKLSYRSGDLDQVIVERGAWWPRDYHGPPKIAMEDREAEQSGLHVGDRLRFTIQGETLEGELVAIYGQRRFQTKFWLEAILSDGVLDPYITRYVGVAYMPGGDSLAAQARIGRAWPSVITVRTEGILEEARALLGRAAAGVSVIAGVCLLASLLVLVSVVATSRVRQIYEATLLHTLGVRIRAIRRGLALEYALVALVTSAYAVALGSVIAWVVIDRLLELQTHGAWWTGVAVAVIVSVASLGLGARHLLRALRLSPARLLRASG